MRDDLRCLWLRQAVIHRAVKVIWHLRDLTGSDERRNGDQAPVARRKLRSQPQIAKENVGRVLHQARRDIAELASNARSTICLSSFIQRKRRNRRGGKLV